MRRIFEVYQKAKYATRVLKVQGIAKLYYGLITFVCAKRIGRVFLSEATKEMPDPLNPDAGFIVSLTSFPKRINRVWMVVNCLMRQTCRPAEIHLNLFEGEFPNGLSDLPENLVPYLKLGLKIRFVSENLMPHLKYFYCFKEEMVGKKRIVITVDDDLFYAPDTLERLLRLNNKYPEAVAGNICKQIRGDVYRNWKSVNYASGPSSDLIALGFGAVLYPYSFYGTCHELYDIPKLKSLSLRADDLWLKHCEMINDKKVVTGEFYAIPLVIGGTQSVTLSKNNVSNNMNDVSWKLLSSERNLSH